MGVELDNSEISYRQIARTSRGGGQKMNRKSTAVELTHNPTGTIVWCQDKRTPEQNYELALLNLRYEVDKIVNGSTSLATLYERSLSKKLEGIEKKEADLRKSEREDEENLRD